MDTSMIVLEALDEIVVEALDITIECHENRNIICINYTNGASSEMISGCRT
jgi:hypothetical protein